jgi:heat shock protein HtpX
MSIQNQIKTVLLLGSLTGLLLLIGYVIGGQNGLLIGLIFAGGMNFFSYWFSDKIVLRMYKAREADKYQEAKLYQILESIIQRTNLPMPKLYVIDTPQSNAFATGRNPKNAAVAVTTGLMKILNENELRAVLAHEIGHVKNRDILISSIAATIAGVISYVAFMARWAAIFGGRGGNDRNNIFELLALAIIAPLMAMIIQFAISRSREFLADETGAKITKDPHSLASALEKIQSNVSHHPFRKSGTTNATAHMFIHHPFTGKSLFQLFSTHPSTKERVKRLKEMQV